MTKDDALILLRYAPNTAAPSAIYASLTQEQAVGIIRRVVEGQQDGLLSAMLRTRVLQRVQNRKHPHEVWGY